MLNQITDSDQAQAAQQLQDGQPDHEASFSHELIAGAASYEAAKAYENHFAQNGRFIILPTFFHLSQPRILSSSWMLGM